VTVPGLRFGDASTFAVLIADEACYRKARSKGRVVLLRDLDTGNGVRGQ